MSDYTKTVDFAAKDSLPSGNSGKIIKGTEFETEFDNIATAIATKANLAGPTFTGVLTFASFKGATGATVTTILDEDDMATNSATALATQQSIKAYVDAQQDTVDTLAEILALSNTTGGTDLAVSTGDDITFADSSKAIFGAGSDLQIYHDGSNSIIYEGGTGDLQLRGNGGSTTIMNGGGTETLANFGNNGAVTLYYDNAVKLSTTATGVDITGTATMDGLTVSDSQAGGVTAQIQNSDSTQTGGSRLDFLFSGSTVTGRIQNRFNGGDFQTDWYTGNDGLEIFTDLAKTEKRLDIANNGDVSFYEDTGTTAKLFWDASAESLTLSGTGGLTVDGDVLLQGDRDLHLVATNPNLGTSFQYGEITFGDSNSSQYTNHAKIVSKGTYASNADLGFYTLNTERMLIDSSGNVRVGTGNTVITGLTNGPNLVVGDANGGEIVAYKNTNAIADGDFVGAFLFGNDDNSGTEDHFAGMWAKASGTQGSMNLYFTGGRSDYEAGTAHMTVDSLGNVGIGTSSPDTLAHLAAAAGSAVLRLENTDTGLSDTEVVGKIEFETQDAGGAGVNSYIQAVGQGTGGANKLQFGTGTANSPATRMTIDSNGNVGIGTDSPAAATKLHISGAGTQYMRVENTTTSVTTDFGTTATGSTIINRSATPMMFFTDSTERVRIDASGNLLVGKTSANNTTQGVTFYGAVAPGAASFVRDSGNTLVLNRLTTDGEIVAFRKDNTTVGSVSVTSSATAYNTSSDQRLKENIVDAPSASDDIDAIQVRSFDWKANGSHQKYGMVAQELQTVAPEAVSAPEDPEEMMGVDYSKLVPMLIKEVQQLRARVAQLEGAN